MLNKILHGRTFMPSLRRQVPAKSTLSDNRQPAASAAAVLKIVHAGGFVDSYYMAVQAATIIEKHPSFLLARPEVFRRPWESVVRPEEVLVPGEKYYVVPRRTIWKLRCRIRRGSGDSQGESAGSRSFSDMSECGMTSDCFASRSMPLPAAQVHRHRAVKVVGLSTDQTRGGPARKGEEMAKGRAGAPPRRRKAKKMVTWQPELTAISESSAVY